MSRRGPRRPCQRRVPHLLPPSPLTESLRAAAPLLLDLQLIYLLAEQPSSKRPSPAHAPSFQAPEPRSGPPSSPEAVPSGRGSAPGTPRAVRLVDHSEAVVRHAPQCVILLCLAIVGPLRAPPWFPPTFSRDWPRVAPPGASYLREPGPPAPAPPDSLPPPLRPVRAGAEPRARHPFWTPRPAVR